ncbi:PREDICTED: protein UXT homolog [Camelina sativa]|uniref:Protein UXT homolog n=1 Tax=Camelina sativa TaxID=90675 RepID=A0ABM1QDQ0_CAMSA|nr:PREDICTED: protein UXT homolog [Camelina sativa]
MDEGRQKNLQLLEEIIDKGLKQKLVHATASRDKIFEEQKVLSDLRISLETLEKNGVNSLKTMVNLGSEVYMQAEVLGSRHIFMDIGLGFYVEFTRQEALDHISQREERIKKFDIPVFSLSSNAACFQSSVCCLIFLFASG